MMKSYVEAVPRPTGMQGLSQGSEDHDVGHQGDLWYQLGNSHIDTEAKHLMVSLEFFKNTVNTYILVFVMLYMLRREQDDKTPS